MTKNTSFLPVSLSQHKGQCALLSCYVPVGQYGVDAQ